MRWRVLVACVAVGCVGPARPSPAPTEWVCEYPDGVVLYLGADSTDHESDCAVRALRRRVHSEDR